MQFSDLQARVLEAEPERNEHRGGRERKRRKTKTTRPGLPFCSKVLYVRPEKIRLCLRTLFAACALLVRCLAVGWITLVFFFFFLCCCSFHFVFCFSISVTVLFVTLPLSNTLKKKKKVSTEKRKRRGKKTNNSTRLAVNKEGASRICAQFG